MNITYCKSLKTSNKFSIFGLSDDDICFSKHGVDIAFEKLDSLLIDYFQDKGFRLHQRDGYKVLSLRYIK